MTDRVERLIAELSQLPPDERDAIIEGVIITVHAPSPAVEEVWAKEAEARLNAYEAGRCDARDLDTIVERITRKW